MADDYSAIATVADDYSAIAAPVGNKRSGKAENVKAGFVEGLTGLPEMAEDWLRKTVPLFGSAIDAAHAIADAVQSKNPAFARLAKDQGKTPEAYAVELRDKIAPTAHNLNSVLPEALNPENVTATTTGERVARGAGMGLSGAFLPAGEVSLVANLLKGGAIGAAAGAGGAGLAEVAPDELKPAANVMGAILTGLVTHRAGVGMEAAARGAGRLAAPVIEPIAAVVNPSAAETAAGRQLSAAASDPASVAAALELPGEIIPGSQPTTFQQTGDMGLGALERGVAARNPEQFTQRRAEQNTARTTALEDIQQGADANDVAKALKSGFDDLNTTLDSDVAAAEGAASAKAAEMGSGGHPPMTVQTLPQQLLMVAREHGGYIPKNALSAGERAALEEAGIKLDPEWGGYDATDLVNEAQRRLKAGEIDPAISQWDNSHVDALNERYSGKGAGSGDVTPEGAGASVRGALADAQAAAKAEEGRLWSAVDPEGDLTANVGETSQAAKRISGEQPKSARPMEGEEAAVFEVAGALPAVSPLSELIALRSRVSDAMRAERSPTGSPQALRRLTQLRGAIESNLSNTIAHQVAVDDAAVARGMMPEEDALRARLQAQADEWRDQRPAASGNPVRDPAPAAGGRASAVPGQGGADGQAAGGLPDAAGDPSLPPGPTVDADAAARLKAASDATKARAGTFGAEPVKASLNEKGVKGDYSLPNGEVPRKFFRPGVGGYDAMQTLLKAAPQSLQTMVDYAATSLRRAAADASGVIDPTKFKAWAKAHADALRALPADARAKFADAAAAGQTVADALAKRSADLKEAQTGALGKVMNLTTAEDVTKTVGQVLNGRTAVADMVALVKATKGNPAARQGLRQAVADFMTSKLIGNTEAGTTGQAMIKADAYLTFIKDKRAALNLVFKPEEVRTMEAIGEDLRRSKRSENAVKLPGSNTAQDTIAAKKGLIHHGGRTILDALAGVAGFHLGGAIMGGAAIVGSHLLQSMRASGIAKIDQLLTEAMLHPEVARELLKKAPAKANPNATKPLAAALRTAQRASFAAAHSEDDRK